LGVDPQWPPFSSYDKQGQIRGIDVEIVNLIGKRTGLNMQLGQNHQLARDNPKDKHW